MRCGKRLAICARNLIMCVMKTLIIYYHPHEGSFCSAIRDAVQAGLQAGGYEYKVIDLGADGFDLLGVTEGILDIKKFLG